jgi:hypothetical protein
MRYDQTIPRVHAMDYIGTGAKFISSLIPGGQDWESVRTIANFLAYVTIVGIIAFLKPIAFSFPFIRRRLAPGERYAGQYVQIIRGGENRRYSLLSVRYLPRAQTYMLIGYQYDIEGRRAIDFDSHNVAFRQDGPIDFMEFTWRAEVVADKSRFDGYTMMRFDDTADEASYEGRGFFITFHEDPERFNLHFIKLTPASLGKLNAGASKSRIKIPKTEPERSQFIVRLHQTLVQHPHLQPDEPGKALL